MKNNGVAVLTICFFLFCLFPSFASSADTLLLSAQKVQDLALEQNYSVQVAKLQKEIAKQAIPQAKGVYDTNLGLDANHNINDTTKTSAIFGGRIDTTTAGISATKKFATGTEAGLGFSNVRTKYHNNLVINGNPIYPPNALYEPILSFSLNQPLMKNVAGFIDRKTVQAAEIGSLASELTISREIQTIVYNALANYWNWVLIRHHIQVLEKSVLFAENFLKTTLSEYNLGTKEETDVLAAKANVLVRKDQLLMSKELERTWQESLRVNLGIGPEITLNNQEKLPPFFELKQTLAQAINTAYEKRRDYLASKQELELRNVNLAIAKNTRWPTLDIYGSLDLNDIQTSYAEALSNLDNPNLTVGLQFSVPLENRVARANKRIADFEKTQALVALKDLQNRIANNVSRTYQEVLSRRTIINQSQEALKLQVKKLEQEMEKYSFGRSSSDLVIRYQDDVINSERANVDAWVEYQSAVLNLQLAMGTLVYAPHI
ncbi:MAG: TolC family protein [Pseudomonadota bacterium]